MLNDSGFFDKKLVIQQGGTYTGQDDKVNNLAEYQSEEDQASYLVKGALLVCQWRRTNSIWNIY